MIKGELLKEHQSFKSFIEDYKSADLLNYSKWLIKSNKRLNDPTPIYLRKCEAELFLLREKKVKILNFYH